MTTDPDNPADLRPHPSGPATLIAELRRHGLDDQRVLAAIARVPRHRFVPPEVREHAWANVALPIGGGQTISQPFVVALMTAALRLSGVERVLEIGTGSGYQAAILAELAHRVISVERQPDLARAARQLLDDLGYDNVETHTGDGTLGWPPGAPYDRIIVTAGSPAPPPALLEQLDPRGGRLVIPVGDADDQTLLVIHARDGALTEVDLGPVRFVPLIGEGGWPARGKGAVSRRAAAGIGERDAPVGTNCA